MSDTEFEQNVRRYGQKTCNLKFVNGKLQQLFIIQDGALTMPQRVWLDVESEEYAEDQEPGPTHRQIISSVKSCQSIEEIGGLLSTTNLSKLHPVDALTWVEAIRDWVKP